MHAMKPCLAGQKHKRAFAGNHRDALRLAEADGVRGGRALSRAAEHPHARDVRGGALFDKRFRHCRRGHKQGRFHGRLNILQVREARLALDLLGIRIHRHRLISSRQKLAEEGSGKVAWLARDAHEGEAFQPRNSCIRSFDVISDSYVRYVTIYAIGKRARG